MLLWKKEVGSFAANCYLVACEETGAAVLIDPGAEPDRIRKMVYDAGVQVKFIINTHGHIDHVGANAKLRDELGVPIMIHEEDAKMCESPHLSLAAYVGDQVLPSPDTLLQDGDKIELGELTLEVVWTPGHTPGCISLAVNGALFTGDTLFAGSVGRTDLPGGSSAQIIASIKDKLLIFPDETTVYPGHGEASTIGREKNENPFLRK